MHRHYYGFHVAHIVQAQKISHEIGTNKWLINIES